MKAGVSVEFCSTYGTDPENTATYWTPGRTDDEVADRFGAKMSGNAEVDVLGGLISGTADWKLNTDGDGGADATLGLDHEFEYDGEYEGAIGDVAAAKLTWKIAGKVKISGTSKFKIVAWDLTTASIGGEVDIKLLGGLTANVEFWGFTLADLDAAGAIKIDGNGEVSYNKSRPTSELMFTGSGLTILVYIPDEEGNPHPQWQVGIEGEDFSMSADL